MSVDNISDMKKCSQVAQTIAIHRAEELLNAKNKLEKKNLDLIVLNSLSDKGAGFYHDTNKITIVDYLGKVTPYKLKKKQDVSSDIFKHIIELI